jgi:predicted nucleotidyltransferase
MTRVARALAESVGCLERMDARFALVGGFAVSARSEPRFTRDVDIAVAVADDEAAEAVVFALTGVGYVPRATVEQEAVGRLATVRLASEAKPLGGVILDLLFASSGIEPEIVESAQRIELLAGLVVPVAVTGHLIALKVLSRSAARPQDAADLIALSAVASATDWEEAERAAALIEARGFSRGKALLDEVRAVRADRGGGG